MAARNVMIAIPTRDPSVKVDVMTSMVETMYELGPAGIAMTVFVWSGDPIIAQTLPAKVVAVTFTATAATTEAGGGAADAQTFVKTSTTAATSKNHWDNAANYSGGALPVSTSRVSLQQPLSLACVCAACSRARPTPCPRCPGSTAMSWMFIKGRALKVE